jgi:hypothetical protein
MPSSDKGEGKRSDEKVAARNIPATWATEYNCETYNGNAKMIVY